MNKYLDMLMMNYPLEDSDEELEYKYREKERQEALKNNKNIQYGGAQDDDEDHPYGGFPPIFLCGSKKQLNEENKAREYNKQATAISIKDIMKKRRDSKPFIM